MDEHTNVDRALETLYDVLDEIERLEFESTYLDFATSKTKLLVIKAIGELEDD